MDARRITHHIMYDRSIWSNSPDDGAYNRKHVHILPFWHSTYIYMDMCVCVCVSILRDQMEYSVSSHHSHYALVHHHHSFGVGN